jgi:hypothetical protein
MDKILILFLVVVTLGCSTTPKLIIGLRPAYNKSNTWTRDSSVVLTQSISFNKKNTVDEEYWETLTINILDTTSITKKRVSPIADSTKIKMNYRFRSTWRNRRDNRIDGYIKILNWSATQIKIKERLKIQVTGQEKVRKYWTTLTFTKTDKKQNR